MKLQSEKNAESLKKNVAGGPRQTCSRKVRTRAGRVTPQPYGFIIPATKQATFRKY